MTETLVPTVRTPFTQSDIARLVLVHCPELGKAGAGVLWSQFEVECGAGGQHCYGNNLGNIKHFKGDGYDFHSLKGVWEVVDGKTVVIDAGAPGSWFRAHASLDAGFLDHLKFLQSARYRPTWPLVVSGQPDGFARKLGACGYFTAPPDTYASAMSARHKAWMASSAFDEALELLERPTLPSIVTADQLEEEPAIVHAWVPLGRPALDE